MQKASKHHNVSSALCSLFETFDQVSDYKSKGNKKKTFLRKGSKSVEQISEFSLENESSHRSASFQGAGKCSDSFS
jgi:hypothetical protein